MLPHFWRKKATPALPKISALSGPSFCQCGRIKSQSGVYLQNCSECMSDYHALHPELFSPKIATQETPATPVGASMSTAPVTTNKFESILTGVGKFIQNMINAEINIAIAEKPLIYQFLPASMSSAIDTAEQVALTTYLQIEAQEQTIGASSTAYAGKVAQVIALQGAALAKILASAGLESGQTALQTLVTGATGFTQIGKITVLTAPAA